MMDFKTSITIKTIITIAFFIVTNLANQILSLDPKFEACAPKTCGKGPDISYPFWLPSEQESYCGYPNFEITCNNESYPILSLSDEDYTIKDIFYPNNSFHIFNSAVYEDTCPTPLHNVTLNRTPFNISTSYSNLSFLYNCSSKPSQAYMYPIDCASSADTYSFATFHLDALESSANYSSNSCKHLAVSPVHTNGDVLSLIGRNYSEILEIGFLLNWTAQNCSACSSSGGRCGFESNEFVCFCPDKPRRYNCDDGIGNGLNWRNKLIVGVCTAVVCLTIMSIGFYIYQRRKRNQYIMSSSSYLTNSRSISSKFSQSRTDIEKGSKYYGVHVFTYEELEVATNYFDPSKELGDGGFGTVYYGKLRDGREVAVKRLYESNYKRVEQFMNEIDILARRHHRNLVSLYGCTSRHSRELILVYEYISNGTVADHLHGEKARPGSLPWSTRMNISVETASALAYLHASDIIHRDVKTNNILLDKNFSVKVADFGLSRLFPTDVTHVSTAPQGTPGYVDPEYHQCYQLTSKSDVYSFGVVLIELISSMPAVDITRHRHEINLSNMAINKIQSHALHELVDQNLGFRSDIAINRMISSVAELAFQCLQGDKDMRPSMTEVLDTLKAIQSRNQDSNKADEMEIPSDDVVLLKSGPLQLSPDSVTMKWISGSTDTSTTPHTSS